MHKMSTKLHKNSGIKVPQDSSFNTTNILINSDTPNVNGLPRISAQDIEKENRLSKVISLYSKGFSQEQIAAQIGVNQCTISRDLQLIKQEAKSQIDKFLKDISFEHTRYLAGSNEVIRELWEVVQDRYSEQKERISALKLLLHAYDKRHQRLIGEPESYLNLK